MKERPPAVIEEAMVCCCLRNGEINMWFICDSEEDGNSPGGVVSAENEREMNEGDERERFLFQFDLRYFRCVV